MKKIVMAGTEEEVQFGDFIEADYTTENERGGITHHHVACRLIPELVELLIEHGIIDVINVKEEKEEKQENSVPLDMETMEIFHRLDALEKTVDLMAEQLKSLLAIKVAVNADKAKKPEAEKPAEEPAVKVKPGAKKRGRKPGSVAKKK